jgi:Ca2+-binding RTX toxin-like protein
LAYQNYAGAWLPESVVGPNIPGSTPNTTYYGPNQNNSWGVTGDGATLVGGNRDDYYWLTNPGQHPVEAAGGGTDTVRIWQSYVLPQNIENLIVFGDGQYAIGNNGDNIIQALGAREQLYGGLGNDVFVGSGGSGTTFVIGHGEGDKAIQNFNVSTDTVRMIGSTLTTFDQVKGAMSQQGSDVVLNDAGAHIVFRNTTVGAFQARDFALPLDYSKLGAQTLNENFDSASTIGTNWRPYFGTGGIDGYTLRNNGELEIYTSPTFTGTGSTPLGLNPFSFNGGVMTISANPVSAAQSSQMWGYKYSSGMLYSEFSQQYGYFEMRAELPKGQGLWPAFWLLGEQNKEIDVLEALGTDTRVPDFAVHTPSISPGYSYHGFNPYADGMHTYGLMWDQQHLTYYVDGVQAWQTDTPWDANVPMHLIVNLAVGGNWPGAPDGSTPWPAQYKVDYIRAFKLPGDGTNTATPPPPPAADASAPPPPSAPAPAPSGGAQTLTANAVGSVLTGGAGADTITASPANDTLTGGGGADRFVLASEPWSPIHITDFQVGSDKLDLSALLQKSGYSGADPIADRFVYLQSDGAGGTLVRFDRDGAGGNPVWPNTIVDLEHVSPSGLTWAQLQGAAAGGSGATGSTDSVGSTGSTGATAGGQTLTATGIGSSLAGGSGADTLTASQANDTLTGGAGADRFVLASEPWSPIHITDFQVGSDRLDLSALLSRSGYSGADPIADHYVYLVSDGAGGTIVRFDRDGAGGNPVWPNTIVDLEHVSPTGLTWAQLQGSGAAAGGSADPTGSGGSSGAASGGQVLTASGPNAVLTGGSGADTLNASQGFDTLTGGAGSDRFVLGSEPWAPIHIADFTPGSDKLDLSALFKASGYAGSDPVADHYVYVQSDGAGGSLIRFDRDGSGGNPVWPNTIVDLEHVAPAQVTSSDWIIH